MSQVEALLEPWLFEEVHRRSGSISAEHGVGRCKLDYMEMIKGNETLSRMMCIKRVFDPHEIMNPGKLIPLR